MKIYYTVEGTCHIDQVPDHIKQQFNPDDENAAREALIAHMENLTKPLQEGTNMDQPWYQTAD